jgi:hypothetical protein
MFDLLNLAAGQGNKSLEESFVVLGSASLLRPGHAGSGGSGGSHSSETAVGLDAKLQALAQIFEIASTATHVDHPVCLDCAAQLKDEIEAQVSTIAASLNIAHPWL